MTLKMLPIALALALCPMISGAEQTAASPATETSRDWAAWGGSVALRLNENLLGSMGISIQSRSGKLASDVPRLTDGLSARQALGSELFALRERQPAIPRRTLLVCRFPRRIIAISGRLRA